MDMYLSEYADGCLLYPIYCSVEVPPDKLSVLDKIIIDSRKGLLSIDSSATGETQSVSGALFFMDSGDSDDEIARGSHIPMLPFVSFPHAGKSLQEIYIYFRETSDQLKQDNPGDDIAFPLSMHNFAVIDERTLKDGTLLLCSDTISRSREEESGELAQNDEASNQGISRYGLESNRTLIPKPLSTLRSDGYGSLIGMIGQETGKIPLSYYESFNKRNRQFVYTKEYIHYDNVDYLAHVQAKTARGEPLSAMERNLTGLNDEENSEEA